MTWKVFTKRHSKTTASPPVKAGPTTRKTVDPAYRPFKVRMLTGFAR